MIRPKAPLLVGLLFFFCILCLHIQPLFGAPSVAVADKDVETENETVKMPAQGSKSRQEEEKSKSAEDSKHKGEEGVEEAEKNIEEKHFGGKLEGGKLFKEVADKDTEILKEYLKHENHKENKLDKNSDPKEVIQCAMDHLRAIEMEIEHENVSNNRFEFEWEHSTFLNFIKYEIKWLNFVRNRESIEKGEFKYFAARPVMKKSDKVKENPNQPNMPMPIDGDWEEVGLKEMLEVVEKYNKKEQINEEYSFDNVKECEYIKKLVHEMEDGEKENNQKKIEKEKNELRKIWEKEEEALCGKEHQFKGDEHKKKLQSHNTHAWIHLLTPKSRIVEENREAAENARKEKSSKKDHHEGKEGKKMELDGKEKEGEEEEEKGGEEKKAAKGSPHGEHAKNNKEEEEKEPEHQKKEKETKTTKEEGKHGGTSAAASGSGASEDHHGNGNGVHGQHHNMHQ